MGVFYFDGKRLQYLDGYNSNLSAFMNKKYTPFDLDSASDADYQKWREWKLSVYPETAKDIVVEIDDPFNLTAGEKQQVQASFLKANMAIYTIKYTLDFTDKRIVEKIGSSFGLKRLDSNLCADNDSITSLEHIEGGRKQGYIPYSNLKLSWHTDGYYNLPDEQIRGVILHCARQAEKGGENALVDHEMLYIHLRDRDPAYISALMEPSAMTIPANIENGIKIREAQAGPVFSIDSISGALHMRYSARKRNIEWADNQATREAVELLDEFLASDSPWILKHRLQPGQGLICNNVLHNRTAFEDGANETSHRLIFRGRYFDRIAQTSLHDVVAAMNK